MKTIHAILIGGTLGIIAGVFYAIKNPLHKPHTPYVRLIITGANWGCNSKAESWYMMDLKIDTSIYTIPIKFH